MINNQRNKFAMDIHENLAKASLNIFTINGDNFVDKKSIFSAFAKVMMFPENWGCNWDALFDCLTDLSWIQGEKPYIIICKNFNSEHFENIDDWNTLNNILMDAIAFWRDEGDNSMAILFM